jgi:hypothetical protein
MTPADACPIRPVPSPDKPAPSLPAGMMLSFHVEHAMPHRSHPLPYRSRLGVPAPSIFL